MASSVYPEIDLEVVQITLAHKTTGATVSYSFAEDFYEQGGLHTTNPPIYPLLAGPVQVSRAIDTSSRNRAVKTGVTIQVYADSHLSTLGKSFIDLLEVYDIHNAPVTIFYYPKQIGHLTTFAAATNIRQTLRALATSFDSGGASNTGIMTIQCLDVWFKNQEVSKRLDDTTLSGLPAEWVGKYGGIVFGQSTDTGEGIPLDAPYFESEIDGSNRPVAKLFSGFTFPNHPNKALKRLFAQNQNKDQNRDEWVVVSLENDPQTAGGGESVSSPVADPPNYARDLGIYQRGITVTPSSSSGKILTATSAKMVFRDTTRCVDMIDGQHLFNNSNLDMFSAGNSAFTVEIWLDPDLLHTTSNRYIMRQGETSRSTAEWALYFNTSDDKITFGVSSNGTSYGTTAKSNSAVSAGTLYQVIAYYDPALASISIVLNDGTVTSTGSAVTPTARHGVFSVGTNLAADPGYDGTMWMFRYWNRALSSTEITSLYNSGRAIAYGEMDDDLKVGLQAAYDFDEPYGLRKDSAGSAHLSTNSTGTSISTEIGYNYTNVTTNLGGDGGVPVCDVESMESFNSGATVGKKNTTYRTATTATNNANFYSSLTSGNGATAYWNIDPPLVMPPSAGHLVTVDLSGQQDFLYALACYYDSHGGSSHYARNKLDKAANWALQADVRLDLLLYYLGFGDDSWTNGTASGADRYSYLHLEAKSIGLYDDVTRKTFAETLKFKICVSGLQDDASGTYTGTPSSVIEKPQHIVKFVLMNADFGLGLGSTEVDTASIDAAVAAMDAIYVDSLKMQIVIDEQTNAEDFILEICRQARMVFYKTRTGLLALKFPRFTSAVDAAFSEAWSRGDMILDSYGDNDYSSVINDFRQSFRPDTVNQPDNLQLARSDPRIKLSDEILLNDAESTAGDSARIAKMAASQLRYGKRAHTALLDYYDSATYAQVVQNYYADRYSTLQRRAVVRVPRKNYYATLDLFSVVRLEHTAIPCANGSAAKLNAQYQGSMITTYHEGVPVVRWQGGIVTGEVIEVREQGPWMTLTIETVDGYS